MVLKKIKYAVREFLKSQFLRFALVGITNTLVSYVTYLLIIFFSDGNYILANIAGFISGTLNAYFWNSRFVFKQDKNRINVLHLIKTFLSYGMTCAINTGFLYIMINYLFVPAIIAPVVNSGITFTLNYILNKLWVYRRKEKDEE